MCKNTIGTTPHLCQIPNVVLLVCSTQCTFRYTYCLLMCNIHITRNNNYNKRDCTYLKPIPHGKYGKDYPPFFSHC